MIKKDDIYKIGTLTRVHGLRGELNFAFTDDVWDVVYSNEDQPESAHPYLILLLDGIMVPFFLEEWRFRSESVALLKFEDVDDAETASQLAGCEVYFPHSLTPENDDAERRWTSFVGYGLRLTDGRLLGAINEVDDSTANVLFYVQTSQGNELIIPANEELITDYSPTERWVEMRLPEGLIDLNN